MLAARKQFARQGWVLFRACVWLEDLKPAKVFHKVTWQATGLGCPPPCVLFFPIIFVMIFFPVLFSPHNSLKTDSDFLLTLLLFRSGHKNLAEIIRRWWGIQNHFGCGYWSSQRCDCLPSSYATTSPSMPTTNFFNEWLIVNSERPQNKWRGCTSSEGRTKKLYLLHEYGLCF